MGDHRLRLSTYYDLKRGQLKAHPHYWHYWSLVSETGKKVLINCKNVTLQSAVAVDRKAACDNQA